MLMNDQERQRPRLANGIAYVLFSWRGRIDRKTFWLKGIIPLLVLFVALTFAVALVGSGMGLVSLFFLWAILATQLKRLHDMNRQAWWLLLNLVPVGGWVLMVIWCGFDRGTDGPNRYGEQPERSRDVYAV